MAGSGIHIHHGVKVIGISAVSGGGKTAVARRLAEVLSDAVTLHFDDYDDSNVHPADLQSWFAEGADCDAYELSAFTCHLGTLKAGGVIRYPIGGAILGPVKYVVADAPLGREHSASGRFIDLMVFVDTPLDIAMARRVLRDIDEAAPSTAAGALERVKGDLYGYELRARPIYEHFQERMRAGADLIVEGTLGVDRIVDRICSEIESRRY